MTREQNNTNIRHYVEYRSKIHKKWQDSYDESLGFYTMEEPKEIDEYAAKIVDYILAYKDYMDFEVIIEALTHIGSAPNILYDDNGHFAITDDGFQTVCFGDEPVDIETSFTVSKENWFPTIREALNHYLKSYKE